jgi:hypothetical protein
MTNYFVYYKADPDALKPLRLAVEHLFEKVEKQFGVRGRWMRRRDDPTTYMEVYEGVTDELGFEALLARETPPLGIERRIERFIPAGTPS